MYQRWMQGDHAGAVYGTSESGWMDANNILSWASKAVFACCVTFNQDSNTNAIL